MKEVYVKKLSGLISVLALLLMLVGLQLVVNPPVAHAAMGWTNISSGGAINQPYGLAYSQDNGNVYVANAGGATIQEYSNGSWTTIAQPPVPYGVAVDSGGDVYVVDGNNQDSILVYSKSGGVWVQLENIAAEALNWPQSIAIDSNNDIYVVNYGGGIWKHDVSENTWENLNHGLSIPNQSGLGVSSQGITVDSVGNVYVTHTVGNKIYKLGSGASSWTDITYDGDFAWPWGIEVNSSGDLYVADQNHHLVKVLKNGETSWSTLTSTSPSNYPYGLTIDSSDNIYVGFQGTIWKYGPVTATANTANNSVSLNPTVIAAGGTTTVTATGDRQLADGSLEGDERYIPDTWASDDGTSGNFNWDNTSSSYISNYTPATGGNHTITATFKLQKWTASGGWADDTGTDTKTANVSVSTLADADNNTLSCNPDSFILGDSTTIIANGDRQAENGNVEGDQRYLPVGWESSDNSSGTFSLAADGNYTSDYEPPTTGTFTITANYRLQTWDGDSWEPLDIFETKQTTVAVDVPAEADRDQNTLNLSKNSITVGNSVIIMAVGHRQAAAGKFEDDEKYIPVAWTTTEGTSGVFTQDGSGNYICDYTPLKTGTFTITVTYEYYYWDSAEGGSWIGTGGEGADTKDVILIVNSAGGGYIPPAPTPDPTNGDVVDEDGNPIQGVPGTVTKESNGTSTLEMKSEEAILYHQPDGTNAPFEDLSKLSFSAPDVNGTGSHTPSITLNDDGTIQIKNLDNGTETAFDVTVDLGDGQKLVIGRINVKITETGAVSFTCELIDPYGIITDSVTGQPVSGATVTLYYANTERNISNGATPDTMVVLPELPGFEPNDNHDPQDSDASGAYGWMVFPTTDYYIVSTKDGYEQYTSPTISVEQDIVRWDFEMTPLSPVSLLYQAHVQNYDWLNSVTDKEEAGTTGQGLRAEAVKISLVGAPEGAHIKYQAHVMDKGWLDWVRDGEVGGTTGEFRRMEAIKIALENMPGYSIQYQVHVQDLGWTDWVSDGDLAGTTGMGKRLEAIKIKIVKN